MGDLKRMILYKDSRAFFFENEALNTMTLGEYLASTNDKKLKIYFKYEVFNLTVEEFNKNSAALTLEKLELSTKISDLFD